MSKYCVKNCEFIFEKDHEPACSFYSIYLNLDEEKLLRCKKCKEDEMMWAHEQLLKGVLNNGTV